MKYSKNTIYLTLTLAIIAVVVSGCAKKVNPEEKVVEQKVATSTSDGVVATSSAGQVATMSEEEISTKDWKTYRSDNLGIVFKYPKDWFVEEYVDKIGDSDRIYITDYKADTSSSINDSEGISILKIGYGSIKDFTKKDEATISVESLVISGKESIKKRFRLVDQYKGPIATGLYMPTNSKNRDFLGLVCFFSDENRCNKTLMIIARNINF